MNNTSQARDVLTLFATYGFRKASMGDIANAAGFLGEIADKAVACLSQDGDALETLSGAFQIWIGDNVEMMRGRPHGGELLETAIAL